MYRKKFLPYNKPLIGEEEIKEVIDTLKSNWLTMGPKTIQFEKDLAEYLGAKHVITVNSCTAGLHLSLLALGIGEGDEVITSPYTFAATGNVICHVGAKPIFVDVQEDTFNIDPKKIEQAITEKTKAIIIVHFAGQSVDLDEIIKIADKHGLKIIEDAAHAIGSEYKERKIGSMRNLTCYSFYATKNLTTGEGGAIATNDDALADRLKVLRLHGISKDAWKRYNQGEDWYYEILEPGWKYNMTDIQASLGIHQLRKLESFIKKRQEIAKAYDEKLSKIKKITLPLKKSDRNHVYHLYPLLLENYDRNLFIKEMEKRNIGTSVHFIPLHLHPFYQELGYKKGDFPIAENLYSREVSLPLYPGMTDEDVNDVINAINDFLNPQRNIKLRLANKDDCIFLYEWRNDFASKKASRFTKKISYEEHIDWFSKSLKNPEIKIYVALENDKRIGQIRFDKQVKEAEVSITIDPKERGKGYGSMIVKEGSKKYFQDEPNIKVLRAEIRPENSSSIRVFEKSGYKEILEKETPYGTFLVFNLLKSDNENGEFK